MFEGGVITKMNRKVGRPKKGQVIEKDYDYENARTKVAHLVRRSGLDKKCVICGKSGTILHNRENPYMISFICNDCRKDPEKEAKADKLRFDIRDAMPKRGTHILRTSSDSYVTQIVSGYLKDVVPIREYCRNVGISSQQFHKLVERYKELYPNQPIEENIKSHRNTVHRHRIQQSKQVEV